MKVEAVADTGSNNIQRVTIDIRQGVPTSSFFESNKNKYTQECDDQANSIPFGNGSIEE